MKIWNSSYIKFILIIIIGLLLFLWITKPKKVIYSDQRTVDSLSHLIASKRLSIAASADTIKMLKLLDSEKDKELKQLKTNFKKLKKQQTVVIAKIKKQTVKRTPTYFARQPEHRLITRNWFMELPRCRLNFAIIKWPLLVNLASRM